MTRERSTLLDRVKEQVAPPADAFKRLQDRREAKARRARVEAGAVGLGLTGALVAALLVWSPLSDDGNHPDRVGTQGSPVRLVAEQGEYYYLRFVWYEDPQRPTVTQVWYGPDDSGRRVVTGRSEPLDDLDERFGPGEFPAHFVPELSTDPDELLQQLIQRGSAGGASPNPIATSSPGRSQETTSLIRSLQDLLTLGSDAFLTPEQIAAAFQASQGIDAVTTEPGVTDPLGRTAVRLSFVIDYNSRGGSTVEWYFEPTTGQFMGQVWINEPSGRIAQTGLIETAGIATSMDDPPAPDARYVPEGDLPATLRGIAGPTPEPTAS